MKGKILDHLRREGKSCLLVDGDSGSGKTTLLLDLVRTLINEKSEGFSFAPQYPNIFSGTIEENINFFRLPADNLKIRDVMNEVGLEHLDANFNLQSGGEPLSGGERQRLVLVRSLISEYRNLIVIDEGFSAMDDATASSCFDLVRRNFDHVIYTAHGDFLKRLATDKIYLK